MIITKIETKKIPKLNYILNRNHICLLGKMRAGKDTLGKYLCNKQGFKRYAFGDRVKHHYHKIFGYEGGFSPRLAYQWFGQAMRQHYQNVWVDWVKEQLDEEKPEKFVITDCRQVNEYNLAIQKRCVIVRIESDEQIRIKRMKQLNDVYCLNHETETALDMYPAHLTITNNGTVEEMIQQFKLLFESTLLRNFYISGVLLQAEHVKISKYIGWGR